MINWESFFNSENNFYMINKKSNSNTKIDSFDAKSSRYVNSDKVPK